MKAKVSESLRENVKSAPKDIGVYWFLSKDGTILYIGKSVNLKQRLYSYLNGTLARTEPRILKMVGIASNVKWQVLPSEFIALLEEDRLIKEVMPEYNIRQREFADYRYLQLSQEAYPALHSVSSPDPDMGIGFGPFKDKYVADDIKSILSRYFKFRSCTERDPVSVCPDLDIGLCSGPCAGRISEADYSETVENVSDFLSGKRDTITNLIRNTMQDYSNSLNFEAAGAARKDLDYCQAIFRRQQFFHLFKNQYLSIMVPEHKNEELIFHCGKQVNSNYPVVDLIQPSTGSTRNKTGGDYGDQHDFDRAVIVYNWIKQKKVDFEFSQQKPE